MGNKYNDACQAGDGYAVFVEKKWGRRKSLELGVWSLE
jgi:hypothetical protein